MKARHCLAVVLCLPSFGEDAAIDSSGQAAMQRQVRSRSVSSRPVVAETDDAYGAARNAMVDRLIEDRGVEASRVLDVMRSVPRHRFVPESVRESAYDDRPLTIGANQTISQPYIVALMTSLLDLEGDEKVLEIGTGSGYQAAVLSELADEVYSIEILDELGKAAGKTLSRLGYSNVDIRIGDGYRGWPAKAPFDAIIVTAASEHVPDPLIDQLAVGGRMVIPIGDYFQDLVVVTKNQDGIASRKELAVRFETMVGEAQNLKKRP